MEGIYSHVYIFHRCAEMISCIPLITNNVPWSRFMTLAVVSRSSSTRLSLPLRSTIPSTIHNPQLGHTTRQQQQQQHQDIASNGIRVASPSAGLFW